MTDPSRRLSDAALHILVAIGPEERHGYAVMTEVAAMTGGAVRMGPGTLYTNIRRLVDDGLLEESDARPAPDDDDERRRYYRLTSLGRQVVATEVQRLDRLVARARPWATTADAG